MSHDPLAPMRGAPGVIRLHGHRGARGILPENTLQGLIFALDLGINAVELDVLLTADGVPVVTHNPRLMAASSRKGGQWLEEEGPLISDLTLDELQSYDIGALRPGSDYGALYPDQAELEGAVVPTLAAVAEMALQPRFSSIWLNIEIKSDPETAGLTPPPEQLAEATVRVIEEAGLEDRSILQSFDWRVLAHAAKLAPDLPRSHLTRRNRNGAMARANIFPGSPWMAGAALENAGGSLPRLVADLGGRFWSPHVDDLDAGEVALAQDLGLVVNTWTVNTPEEFERAIAAGVDGIITDYPGRAQRILRAHGLRWR